MSVVKSSYEDCDDDEAQFEQSLLTYVKKEELSTMKRDTRSLYRYPLDTSRTTVQTAAAATLLDQLTCCLLCNYSATHVNCRQSTPSMLVTLLQSINQSIYLYQTTGSIDTQTGTHTNTPTLIHKLSSKIRNYTVNILHNITSTRVLLNVKSIPHIMQNCIETW